MLRVRFPLAATALLLLATACGDSPQTTANESEWLRVLHVKKAAVAQNASPVARQVYADSLAAFVQQHPQHSRAREVYQHIQLDFANELVAIGRYQDSVRFYRSILANDPHNQRALDGMKLAIDRLSISHQRLTTLQRGMTQHEVAKLLGKPIPGWTAKSRRRDATLESWYYRRQDGGIAAIHFRDGKVFAAEENSEAKIAPLVSVLAR
jgi:hypothetical protein